MTGRKPPRHGGHQSALREFLNSESAGGIVLMFAAAAAMAAANSPLAPAYFGLLKTYVAGLSILHWINDALMAVFFLLVGLEIKRELIDGQLSTWSQRTLPGIAAAGGMIVPAAVYLAINARHPENLPGWGIPTATDIAFALGVLALLGSRIPVSLKVFLTALAIIDDLGAVAIIAAFYSTDLSGPWLSAAAAALVLLVSLNRAGVMRLAPYLALGLALWFFVLQSGVHATLAGVTLAFTIPIDSATGEREPGRSPLHTLEHRLHAWVAFLIVPVFGLANAGVPLGGLGYGSVFAPIPVGIAVGLLVGKQVGIFGATWVAVKLGLARRPEGASFAQIYGVSLICGIGFTMSLFIGLLAFPSSPELQGAVKIGVLSGSLLSAFAGVLVLLLARR